MAKLLTITDPAEDAALLAARIYRQSANYGYDNLVAEGLREAGFGHLVRNSGGHPVTLDDATLLAVVKDALAARGFSTLTDSQADVANAAYGVFGNLGLRDRVYGGILNGTVSYTVDVTVPTFDLDSLLRKYGRSGALPTPEGEHAEVIEAQRQAVTTVFLRLADRDGLCSTFDTALADMGLGKFAPAREAEVSTEVEGLGTVTAKVGLTRAGKIRERDLAAHLRQAVQNAWQERAVQAIRDGKITGLPEGALA